eukprot:TRINITY_DN51955_c0_g1_i1.p1 TRINITY_DN51955_c0_g1~~TRINITY_DN51955_c0_g1_i1.p1  ORF type:complete len:323 (-),score=62.57 TRINITY_DN51955_c0_g1_i1:125-1093(-)
MGTEDAEVAPDWQGLQAALKDLTLRVGETSGGSNLPPDKASPLFSLEEHEEPIDLPQRLPSVFAASSDKDIALLNRCYTPNIFAWSALGGENGVEDDVGDLQLRIASRLRAREEALKQQDLSALKELHRSEIQQVDLFLNSGHAVPAPVRQQLQYQERSTHSQGRPPPPPPPPPLQHPLGVQQACQRSSSSSATCRRSKAHGGAGPLPVRLVDDNPLFSSRLPDQRHGSAGALPPGPGFGFDYWDELMHAKLASSQGQGAVPAPVRAVWPSYAPPRVMPPPPPPSHVHGSWIWSPSHQHHHYDPLCDYAAWPRGLGSPCRFR